MSYIHIVKYIYINTFILLPPCRLLQGKDDFERQQKELLDKENIIKQSQIQLGQEQVRHSRFVMLY